jgi:hypothetical protein
VSNSGAGSTGLGKREEKLENYGDLVLALACQTRRGHVLGVSTLRSTNATPESETGNAEARH